MVRQSKGPKAPSATYKKYDLSIIFTKTTERAKPPTPCEARASRRLVTIYYGKVFFVGLS